MKYAVSEKMNRVEGKNSVISSAPDILRQPQSGSPGKGACKTGMATKKQTGKKSAQSSTKKKTTKQTAVKPAADLAPEWSIFIFGVAVVVLALVFVKGASVWA